MNPNDFTTNAAGQVVPRTHDGLAYWAFVPNPLPPDLTFDRELVRLVSEASAAVGELAGLGLHLRNPRLLIRPLLRREAVLSSRIEGTQTELADLYAYEAQLPLPGVGNAPPEADLHEVMNYVRALEYGLKSLSKLPVSKRLIRDVHARLMRGVRGERAAPGKFRTVQNMIARPGVSLAEAPFVPPPVVEMEVALNELEAYIHLGDDYPELIRLALIHYQFEVIHPFGDGNGRIGRLLMALLLVSWKLLPQPLLYLSAYFEKHRDEYVDRMVAVAKRGEWQAWVKFFLTGVREQATDTLARVKHLEALRRTWHAAVSTKQSSVLQLTLVDHLFSTPIITIPKVAALLGVSYPTAKKHVLKLVAKRILRPADQAVYGRAFVATEIIDLVTKGD